MKKLKRNDVISEIDGRPVTCSWLARKFGVSSETARKFLSGLVEEGLAEVEPCAAIEAKKIYKILIL